MKKTRKNDPKEKYSEIRIKVVPRSSRNEIVGKDGDTYRIKITSPPVDGMANKALIDYLAKCLGIPKRDIEIKTGKNARYKTVRISGRSPEDVDSLLDT